MKNRRTGILLILLALVFLPLAGAEPDTYLPHLPGFMESGRPRLAPEAWEKVSLTGKLHTHLLPLSPTLKVYMERDEVVRARISVPLLGEMASAEVTPSSVRLFNKRKKVYFEKDLTEVIRTLGADISLGNLQDLILGRPYTPGAPALECAAADMEYDIEREAWWLKHEYPGAGVVSAMMLDAQGKILYALCARFSSGIPDADSEPDKSAVISFSYPGSKTRLEARLNVKGKMTAATYEYAAPDWEPAPMAPVAVTPAWTRVESFKEFIKTF